MTKEELQQIRNINQELEYIKKQMELITSQQPGIVTDIVRGSSKHHPYTEHNIIIQDIDYGELEKPLKELREQYQARSVNLLEQIKKVNEWIETISDPAIRLTFAYRYINNLPWSEVANLVGYEEKYLINKHNKYITEKPGA